jgi:hypothetical protein
VLNDTQTGGIQFQATHDVSGTMSIEGQHNHGITPGTQLVTADGGTVTWIASGDHEHKIGFHYHVFSSQPHVHGMDHTHQMDHTHGMDHTHQIPAHTHDIEFGIFEGPTPSNVVVKVDGTVVSGLGTDEQDVDIIPYLAKDGEGRIQRGAWHTIEIAPNSLGRIVASVNTQIFIQSRGGGNF